MSTLKEKNEQLQKVTATVFVTGCALTIVTPIIFVVGLFILGFIINLFS